MAGAKKLNITIASVLLGVLGAILVSSSAFYTVLKFGTLTWSSITVTTISILILNFLKSTNDKEIAITQMIMGSGTTIAAGVAFTMPVYILFGGSIESISRDTMFFTILVGSILGGFVSYIFRSKMLDEDKLEFPVGEATFNVIDSGKNIQNARAVGFGVGVSSIVTILRDASFFRSKPLVPTVFFLKSGLNFYVSPILVGIGYILGLSKTFLWFLGGILVYFISDLISKFYKIDDLVNVKSSLTMGILAGIGFCIFLKTFSFENFIKNSSILVKLLFLAIFYLFFTNMIFRIPLFLSLLSMFLVIFAVIISGYTTGKTGVNPIEINAIITISLISFLNKLFNGLNISGEKYVVGLTPLILFLMACVVTVACSFAGDVLNNFKLCSKVGINPREQFLAQMIGAVASSFIITFLFFLFFSSGKTLSYASSNLKISLILNSINHIPHLNVFFTGFLIGAVLKFFNFNIIIFGIGMYMPFSFTLTVFFGGILSFLANRISKGFYGRMLLFANGLMGGEALVGTFLSLIMLTS